MKFRATCKLALVLAVLMVLCPAAAQANQSQEIGLDGFIPYTTWQRPTLRLPQAPQANYLQVAEGAIGEIWHWSDGKGWYCAYLHCKDGPYPKATLWSEVAAFWAVDAQQIAAPSPAHHALVRRFGVENERYWDPKLGGYSPYPGDRGARVRAYFDDDGWLGLALYEAYKATGESRWLRDAQRSFRFIATRGWDRRHGGIWWNTWHPFHSGIAISVDTLLGALLYSSDGELWQAKAAMKYLNWVYLNPRPYWREGYVAAPTVYAEQLLCEHGFGYGYCEHAGRMAATLAEEDERGFGGVREYVYNFGPQYDSIFLQWMMAYGNATGERFWLHLAQLNASAAAANARCASGLYLSSWWGGPFGRGVVKPHELQTQGSTASLFAWTAVYSQAPQVTARVG